MSLTEIELERAVEGLLAEVTRDDALRAEFESSRREFFAHGVAARSEPEAALAARRHLEWFLLERPSEAFGGVPVECALHALAPRDADAEIGSEGLRALVASQCGVYEVTGVRAGEGAWVRDLAGFGEYPLEEREGSHALEPGDVLVGRIFPVGDSLYRISHAAGFFRNPELRHALLHDLDQARAGHRGVLRMSQAELEAMFWPGERAADVAAAAIVDPVDTIASARTVLRAGGMPAEEVESVLERLSHAPFDPTRLVHGVGDSLAEILESLAFESAVDLEAARVALLAAWPALAGHEPPPIDAPIEPPAPRADSPSTAAVDVRAAMEAFDRGRKEGRDLGQLFRDLERDLQLEADADEVDEELPAPSVEETPDALAPDFPGVVEAMVEEFLWDTEREHGAKRAAEYSPVRKFASFGEAIGVFENIGRRELLLFASVWLPERGELRDAADARGVLDALRAFCAWAEETHEVPLLEAFQGSAASLMDSLPRITAANAHRDRSGSSTAGQFFEYVGEGAVADRQGTRQEAKIPPEIQQQLEPGDRLRAELDRRGDLRVYCCYPAESAALQLG